MKEQYINPETVLVENYPYLQKIDSWRNLSQKEQERLGGDLASISQYLQNKAISDESGERHEALERIADSAWSKPIKNILTVAIGAFGALAIGTALGNFGDSTGRNPIQVGVSAITGGIFAVLTDKYLESFMTKRQMRRLALDEIARIETESQA